MENCEPLGTMPHNPENLGVLIECPPSGVALIRDGARFVPVAGMEIYPGDQFVSDTPFTLVYRKPGATESTIIQNATNCTFDRDELAETDGTVIDPTVAEVEEEKDGAAVGALGFFDGDGILAGGGGLALLGLLRGGGSLVDASGATVNVELPPEALAALAGSRPGAVNQGATEVGGGLSDMTADTPLEGIGQAVDDTTQGADFALRDIGSAIENVDSSLGLDGAVSGITTELVGTNGDLETGAGVVPILVDGLGAGVDGLLGVDEPTVAQVTDVVSGVSETVGDIADDLLEETPLDAVGDVVEAVTGTTKEPTIESDDLLLGGDTPGISSGARGLGLTDGFGRGNNEAGES